MKVVYFQSRGRARCFGFVRKFRDHDILSEGHVQFRVSYDGEHQEGGEVV